MLATRTLKLVGARVTRCALVTGRLDLFIREGRVFCPAPFVHGVELDLSGCLLLPELINSHDHLEFNLFPRLGRGHYGNAVEKARDIYQPLRSPVKEHLAVFKLVRLLWGGIKNLVAGVTTVAHHNLYEAKVFDRRFPVRVIQNFGWADSLHFNKDLVERFRDTPREWLFMIHAAEGTLCNAPWASAVLEPNGNVRPCFFHPAIGTVSSGKSLLNILNGSAAVEFRSTSDAKTNPLCRRCVCSLNWRGLHNKKASA